MKKAKNGGYSLVEVLVAIALLAIITIPTYTCLVLSVRLNAKTDEMLKAQLAVSSAVETLMAKGINPTEGTTVAKESLEAMGVSVDGNPTLKQVASPADGVIVVYHCQCGDPHQPQSSYKVTVYYDDEDDDSNNISVVVTTYVPHQKTVGTTDTTDPTDPAEGGATP